MGTGWQEHLNSLGAKFVAQSTVVVSPVTDEIRSLQQLDGAIVLQKLGVISVTGGDAQTFLQGQFSNDIRQVDATHAQLNSYCTP